MSARPDGPPPDPTIPKNPRRDTAMTVLLRRPRSTEMGDSTAKPAPEQSQMRSLLHVFLEGLRTDFSPVNVALRVNGDAFCGARVCGSFDRIRNEKPDLPLRPVLDAPDSNAAFPICPVACDAAGLRVGRKQRV